jgi:hypothetical protein
MVDDRMPIDQLYLYLSVWLIIMCLSLRYCKLSFIFLFEGPHMLIWYYLIEHSSMSGLIINESLHRHLLPRSQQLINESVKIGPHPDRSPSPTLAEHASSIQSYCLPAFAGRLSRLSVFISRTGSVLHLRCIPRRHLKLE